MGFHRWCYSRKISAYRICDIKDNLNNACRSLLKLHWCCTVILYILTASHYRGLWSCHLTWGWPCSLLIALPFMRHTHWGDVHTWLGSEQFQISGFLSLQGHIHSTMNEGMHEGLQKKEMSLWGLKGSSKMIVNNKNLTFILEMSLA